MEAVDGPASGTSEKVPAAEDLPIGPFDTYFDGERKNHPEDTARSLAHWLVWTLGASIIVHYGAMILLYWNQKTDVAEKFSTFMNAWLPVISGLVGSAMTYSFTKQRQ